MSESLDVTLFEKPSGNVRGIVAAFVDIKGKSKRVAHGTLFTDREPEVSVSVPAKASLTELSVVAVRLNEFVSAVNAADAQRPGAAHR